MSMKEPAMIEQPSAEALELGRRHGADEITAYERAVDIDALIAQRLAAETERWQERDRQRLDQIGRLQETVQSLQSARDERPAPPQRLAHTYQIGDCLCGYGWNCKETGCRKPPPRDPKAWSDADA